MKKASLKPAALSFALACICSICSACLGRSDPGTFLVVSDGQGKVLADLPLADGRFDHVFVHSIHLTLVEEKFVVEASGDLHLYELRYENSGVGMPSDAEGGYRLEDGRFILAMDRTFHDIPLFVSIVPGHGVSVGGTFHPFTEWAKPEDILVLTARVHE